MKYTKQILEAVNKGIKLALDDFEDDEQIQDQSSILSKRKIQNYDSKIDYQKIIGLKELNQKTFIHELMKRLPDVDPVQFKNFGFVNYKITGNEHEWPFITSLNDKMANRIKDKYGEWFDNTKWTTISGVGAFINLFDLEYNRFKDKIYINYNSATKKGQEKIEQLVKIYGNNWKHDVFKDRYNDCVNVIEKLISLHQNIFVKNTVLWVDQISFSNDGAFYTIIYQYFKPNSTTNAAVNKIDVFSTEKIIPDTGLDFNEATNIKSAQNKFKRYLTKNIIKRYDMPSFPRILSPHVINNHAAFIYIIKSNIDFDYRTRCHWRASAAKNVLTKSMPYNEITNNFFSFMFFTLYNHFYIEDNYGGTLSIYEKLKFNDNKPYIIVSSENGEYLVAFYCSYIDYRKYNLSYAIIDNSDYNLMSKDFLKEIEYNHVELV